MYSFAVLACDLLSGTWKKASAHGQFAPCKTPVQEIFAVINLNHRIRNLKQLQPTAAFIFLFLFSWQEVAEPLLDLKEGMDQLEHNKTLGLILSTLLAIGNFLNGTNVSLMSQHFPCSFVLQKSEVKNIITVAIQYLFYTGRVIQKTEPTFSCVSEYFCLIQHNLKEIWSQPLFWCNSLEFSVGAPHSCYENCVMSRFTADGLILGLLFSKLKISKNSKFLLLQCCGSSPFPSAPTQ